MKKESSIESHPVIFRDTQAKADFYTTSTMTSDAKETVNGIEYYIIPIEVSSKSHPFYTGESRIMDTEGRVEKFKARQTKKQSSRKSTGK